MQAESLTCVDRRVHSPEKGSRLQGMALPGPQRDAPLENGKTLLTVGESRAPEASSAPRAGAAVRASGIAVPHPAARGTEVVRPRTWHVATVAPAPRPTLDDRGVPSVDAYARECLLWGVFFSGRRS